MDKSDSESEYTDLYSSIYDRETDIDGKWELARQAESRDETLTDVSNCDFQTDLIDAQMRNLCLKNNYVNDESVRNNEDVNESTSLRPENKVKKHRVPVVPPHFASNITFNHYGSQDINNKPKYRRRNPPQMRTTFKIAYDKEELEKDYKQPKKPISPTYESHIFDKDVVVRKVKPIHKNSIFYDNITFDNYAPQKIEYKPPVVIRDKFISNIFNNDLPVELPKRQKKCNPNIKYSNIDFSNSAKEEEKIVRRPYRGPEDHIYKIFADPSVDNLVRPVATFPRNHNNYSTFRFDNPPEQSPRYTGPPKDKFVSHVFRGASMDNVPISNVNDSTRAGIYSKFRVDSPRGIKTQYNRIDHVNEIFNDMNGKVNFNEIQTINSIHNSMHQIQRQE